MAREGERVVADIGANVERRPASSHTSEEQVDVLAFVGAEQKHVAINVRAHFSSKNDVAVTNLERAGFRASDRDRSPSPHVAHSPEVFACSGCNIGAHFHIANMILNAMSPCILTGPALGCRPDSAQIPHSGGELGLE